MSNNDFKVDLYNHLDDTRYYVRANEDIFKKTLRSLALPKITNVVFYKNTDSKVITIILEINYELNASHESALENTGITTGRNVLLYGVPGVGKSHKINKEYCNDVKFMERVVFHPDYTYSDFVGQILPVLSEKTKKLEYSFVMGPFTKILKKAVMDLEHNYYLIIEEINRGNAPAIFGDVFQLLDRYTKDSYEVVQNPDLLGQSEYGITNFDIAQEVYNDTNHLIKIPTNLYIIATMNTADQNVFTLDTAFQRRWELEHIENDIASAKHANEFVCNSTISWRAFVTVVNEQIVEGNNFLGDSGDKRLGAYFARLSEIKDKKRFSEKVLKYLWDDAFKMDHDKLFSSKYNTVDRMIEDFEKVDGNISFEKILNQDVYKKMIERAVNFAKIVKEGSNLEKNGNDRLLLEE
ncbi:MAG: AAA domain-containing protein [Eubacterium sp.]|jgi:MoxR-like ATPase|nr:AAA domain-containing protein [Eubacterium sp.]